MCQHNLTSRSTSSNCCTAMLISVRDWQKHAHLRDKRTYNEMRKNEIWNVANSHCSIQTRLVQYFVTNLRNTNLLGVNSKDLSESFCLIVTKFFFTTTSLSSLIRFVFMFLSLWSVQTDAGRCCWPFLWSEWNAGVGRGPRYTWLSAKGWLIEMDCMVCVECELTVQSSMRACWLIGMEC